MRQKRRQEPGHSEEADCERRFSGLTRNHANSIFCHYTSEALMLRMRVLMMVMVAMVVAGSVPARPTANDVPFPDGFRDWFLVNTMIVTKDSPIFDQIGGLHHIYVNKVAFATLKASGPYPYPDGSVFADDVHDFSVKDGSYVEGNKKAVTVIVKDAKKYASTGGWGFQVWAGGDPLETADRRCHETVLHLPYTAKIAGLCVFNVYPVSSSD